MSASNDPSHNQAPPGGPADHGGPSASGGEDAADMVELIRYSHHIARKVLLILSERSIPITPTNYRLWYDYHAEGRPELRAILDKLIADRVAFTRELTQALYQRFYSLEATESHVRLLDEAGDKVQNMAETIDQGLVDSMTRSSSYSRNLVEHMGRMNVVGDHSSVQEIVNNLIMETGVVLKAQDAFQKQMEKTSRELSALQDALRRREAMAHTDELTQLPNRRAFNLKMTEETGRASRYKLTLAMIMADLDDFKQVNDHHGHLVGDRLLANASQSIRNNLRGVDFAARYGGEEFAIICPETEMRGAINLAQRLREAIDRTEFTVKGNLINVSMSLGVAEFRRGEETDSFIDRADQALYLAKNLGKNRVCCEGDLG
jgi:diguanylate cyclase